MSSHPPSHGCLRPRFRAPLTVHRLEDRIAPADFFPATADQMVQAVQTANTNGQADRIFLTPGATYTFTDDFNDSGNALPAIAVDGNSATAGGTAERRIRRV